MHNNLKGDLLVGFRELPDKLKRLRTLFAYTDRGRFLSWSLSFETKFRLLDFFYDILLGEFLLQLQDEARETVAAETFFVQLILGVAEVVIVIFLAHKAVISFPRVSCYPLNIKMEVRSFSSSFSPIPL